MIAGVNLDVLSRRAFIMGLRVSFSLLLLAALFASLAAAQQAAVPRRSASKRISTEWTAAEENRLLAKARLGHASSQMWLAAAYEQGWFGKTNVAQALKWFRRAARQGDPDAQNALGQMYENGEGVTQNYAIAAQWYRRAAEHAKNLGGAGQGRNNLGMLYLDGRGVPKDCVQAYLWFKLSDLAGNLAAARAQLSAGQILEAERLAARWRIRHQAAAAAGTIDR